MSGVVAIDGPGGSGKSTVSRRLAGRLHVAHLDTGAYYRAATLSVLRAGVDPSDEKGVVAAVTSAVYEQNGRVMALNGEDVSAQIRGPAVTAAVSRVSAIPAVRRHLVDEQRRWVEHHGGEAVVEGRDIGTVVFPDAAVKVFLTADPEERARRRALELGGSRATVAADLARRDRSDAGRAASPMVPASDALVLDTTRLSVTEVVHRILELIDAAR